jgi:signal transduction histidine kinase
MTQRLTSALNRILGSACAVAVVLSLASFRLLSRRASDEAEATAVLRTREILNGQMADLTRELRDESDTVLRLRSEIVVVNYRRVALAIGVYGSDKRPVFESNPELALGSVLDDDGMRTRLVDGRAIVWKPIELGGTRLGYAVYSTVVEQDQRLVSTSMAISIVSLVLAMAVVFIASRAAIRRLVVVPIAQINDELPRLRDIVDGTAPVRSSERHDSSRTATKMAGGALEIGLLRAALVQFSLRLRQASEDRRHAESELTRSRAIRDLARQTGHDIRSPLAVLETMLGSDAPLSPDRLRLLRSAVARMQEIAANLLNLEKQHETTAPADAGGSHAAGADLAAAVRELVEEKRVLAPAGVELSIQSDIGAGGGAMLAVPPDQLRRVIANLLANAFEAASPPHVTRVGVEIGWHADELVVVVRDDGPGIPEGLRSRLFQRGFTAGKAHGHGLGLAYVKERVEAWGGTVALLPSSTGCVFEIRVPAAPAPGAVRAGA